MTRRLLLIDTETTGLDSSRHEVWEIAVAERHGPEHLWRIEPDLTLAEPKALEVGRFYERTANTTRHSDPGLVCDVAGYRGADAYWSAPRKLAANPTFDAGFLTALLRKHGQAATWHYRLRDIGSMAYGYLSACLALGVEGRDAALGVPSIDASTDDFAKALGVDPDQFERHSALGDCRLLAAMLDVIEGRKS